MMSEENLEFVGSFEGQGPGGVAVLIDVATSNKAATMAGLRALFERFGGTFSDRGAVGWGFDRKGLVLVDRSGIPEEKIAEMATDLGAEHVNTAIVPDAGGQPVECFKIHTAPDDFDRVWVTMEKAGLRVLKAEVTAVPKHFVRVDSEKAQKMLDLIRALHDHQGVRGVYANLDLSSARFEKRSA